MKKWIFFILMMIVIINVYINVSKTSDGTSSQSIDAIAQESNGETGNVGKYKVVNTEIFCEYVDEKGRLDFGVKHICTDGEDPVCIKGCFN